MPEFQEDNRFAEFYHLNLVQRKGQRGNSGPMIFDSDDKRGKGGTNYFDRYQNMTQMNTSSPTITAINNHSAIQFFYKPTDNPHPHLIKLEYVCIGW